MSDRSDMVDMIDLAGPYGVTDSPVMTNLKVAIYGSIAARDDNLIRLLRATADRSMLQEALDYAVRLWRQASAYCNQVHDRLEGSRREMIPEYPDYSSFPLRVLRRSISYAVKARLKMLRKATDLRIILEGFVIVGRHPQRKTSWT